MEIITEYIPTRGATTTESLYVPGPPPEDPPLPNPIPGPDSDPPGLWPNDPLADLVVDALEDALSFGVFLPLRKQRLTAILRRARLAQAQRDAERLLAMEQIAAARAHVRDTLANLDPFTGF